MSIRLPIILTFLAFSTFSFPQCEPPGYHVSQDEMETAIRYYQAILTRDPYREEVHRQLMDAYARAGRRAEAVQQYQECCRILRQDLEVGPSPETEVLYRCIVEEP